MFEAIKVGGRQWQIHKDGEMVCLPQKNTKASALAHIANMERSLADAAEDEAKARAIRAAKAQEIKAHRAAKPAQLTLLL